MIITGFYTIAEQTEAILNIYNHQKVKWKFPEARYIKLAPVLRNIFFLLRLF